MVPRSSETWGGLKNHLWGEEAVKSLMSILSGLPAANPRPVRQFDKTSNCITLPTARQGPRSGCGSLYSDLSVASV